MYGVEQNLGFHLETAVQSLPARHFRANHDLDIHAAAPRLLWAHVAGQVKGEYIRRAFDPLVPAVQIGHLLVVRQANGYLAALDSKAPGRLGHERRDAAPAESRKSTRSGNLDAKPQRRIRGTLAPGRAARRGGGRRAPRSQVFL